MRINNWLIRCGHRYDFGHDWYASIINTGTHVPNPLKRWSLFQVSFSFNEYAAWPYLQIKSGTGSTFSVLFWVYKFGFDIGVLERTWDWLYEYRKIYEDQSE